MNFTKSIGLASFISLAISGCGGDKIYVDVKPDTPTPVVEEIVLNGALWAQKESVFEYKCEFCLSDETGVEVVVDSNGSGIFGDDLGGLVDRVVDSASVTLLDHELGKKVSVTVSPVASGGVTGDAVTYVFQRQGVASDAMLGVNRGVIFNNDGSSAVWNEDAPSLMHNEDFSPTNHVVMAFHNGKSGGVGVLKFDGSVKSFFNPDSATPESKPVNIPADPINPVIFVQSNSGAVAGIRLDGALFATGTKEFGGNLGFGSGVPDGALASGLVAGSRAFAAILSDGTVATWGDPKFGGDSSNVTFSSSDPVTSIVGAESPYVDVEGFAAIHKSGAVTQWGGVNVSTPYIIDKAAPVKKVVHASAGGTTAWAAIHHNGKVTVWGTPSLATEIGMLNLTPTKPSVDVVATSGAFAVLRADGSVDAWGDPAVGGDASAVDLSSTIKTVRLYASRGAFAALKEDGSVVTWGAADAGGDSSSVDLSASAGVEDIQIAGDADSESATMLAIKKDGSFTAWGGSSLGFADMAGGELAGLVSGGTELMGLTDAGGLVNLTAGWNFEALNSYYPDDLKVVAVYGGEGQENVTNQWVAVRQDGSAYIGGAFGGYSIEDEPLLWAALDGKNSEGYIPTEVLGGVAAQLTEDIDIAVWRNVAL